MWSTYILRSWHELVRFKKRNMISLFGLVAMVGLLTFLLSIIFQLNNIFVAKDSEFANRMQLISIIGDQFNDTKLEDIASIEGVEHILPLSNARSYPWSNFRMGDNAVLPVYVKFYDPEYSSFFQDKGLMEKTMEGKTDVIVSAEFSNNVLSLEQYQKAFGIDQPGSLEMLGASRSKLIKQYQDFQIASETIVNPDLEVLGEHLNISIEEKYFADVNRNVPRNSQAQITGQLKSNVLITEANHILLPSPSIKFFVPSDKEPPYANVYIKVETLDKVPTVIDQLRAKGYRVIDMLVNTKFNLNNSSQFLKNISALMFIVLLISIINFAITMFSSIEDRKRDIGIRKALGASSKQIVSGYMLEGLMLVSIASIIGILVVILCFSGLRSLIYSNTITFDSLYTYGLEKKSIAAILQLNVPVSIVIFLFMIIFGAIVSYIIAKIFVRRNSMSLMKSR